MDVTNKEREKKAIDNISMATSAVTVPHFWLTSPDYFPPFPTVQARELAMSRPRATRGAGQAAKLDAPMVVETEVSAQPIKVTRGRKKKASSHTFSWLCILYSEDLGRAACKRGKDAIRPGHY